jgi:hypothetical protein
MTELLNRSLFLAKMWLGSGLFLSPTMKATFGGLKFHIHAAILLGLHWMLRSKQELSKLNVHDIIRRSTANLVSIAWLLLSLLKLDQMTNNGTTLFITPAHTN